jgi:hypothetical protein
MVTLIYIFVFFKRAGFTQPGISALFRAMPTEGWLAGSTEHRRCR